MDQVADFVRVAAYGRHIDDDGRLLVTRFVLHGHPHSGGWTLPGGGMDWGESPAETTAREIKEETGLDAGVGEVLFVQSAWFDARETYDDKSMQAVRIVFDVPSATGQLRSEFDPADTTDAAAFMSAAELSGAQRVPLLDAAIADPSTAAQLR